MGHVTAGPIDLELAFVLIGKPGWQTTGGMVHLLVQAGRVIVEFEDDTITIGPRSYLPFDGRAPHRSVAEGAMATAVLLTERRLQS
jgi:hypothetical protein